MPLEDHLLSITDLGINGVFLLVFYILGKKTIDNAFKEVQEANGRGKELQKEFVDFIKTSYKENTKSIDNFYSLLHDHLKLKENTFELLKEQQKIITDELSGMKK